MFMFRLQAVPPSWRSLLHEFKKKKKTVKKLILMHVALLLDFHAVLKHQIIFKDFFDLC